MKLRSALIKLHSSLFGRCKCISDRSFVKTAYFLSFGRLPKLSAPKTFNEHICAIKCSEEALSYAPYADKYEARSYVAKTVGEKYLNPVLGIYDEPSQIPYDELPDRFVLKCTHASGYNIIVKNKTELEPARCNERLKAWLSKNYYHVGRERNYKNIKPRVMVDSYIDHEGALAEYKIFCFNGKPRLIDMNLFGEGGRKTGIFTPAWEAVPVTLGYEACKELPEKPAQLEELLTVAAELSAPFPFVRVDLYLNQGKILFSELTFTSGGGLVHFSPEKYDRIFGEFFEDKQ